MAEDEYVVEAFTAERADHALADCIGPRSPNGGLHDPDPVGAEDMVEGARELAVTITDQELDGSGWFGRLDAKVPGLLANPGGNWVRRNADHMEETGVELDEHQDVDTAEQYRVDAEEVARHDALGL
jgi:hypothetical protein